jgi:hypothetical protein
LTGSIFGSNRLASNKKGACRHLQAQHAGIGAAYRLLDPRLVAVHRHLPHIELEVGKPFVSPAIMPKASMAGMGCGRTSHAAM